MVAAAEAEPVELLPPAVEEREAWAEEPNLECLSICDSVSTDLANTYCLAASQYWVTCWLAEAPRASPGQLL